MKILFNYPGHCELIQSLIVSDVPYLTFLNKPVDKLLPSDAFIFHMINGAHEISDFTLSFSKDSGKLIDKMVDFYTVVDFIGRMSFNIFKLSVFINLILWKQYFDLYKIVLSQIKWMHIRLYNMVNF